MAMVAHRGNERESLFFLPGKKNRNVFMSLWSLFVVEEEEVWFMSLRTMTKSNRACSGNILYTPISLASADVLYTSKKKSG